MEPINLVIWYKTDNGYKKMLLNPEFNKDYDFFKSIKLKIDIELDKIKQHMISLFDNPDDINLKKPSHIDNEKQIILDKLIEIRKDNIRAREIVKGILADDEFIICDMCKNKMFKIPINVSYSKYGNSYIIHDPTNEVKYIYGCSKEGCVNCILEDNHIELMRNLELRDKLISEGKKFIPNKFGFWHYI